MASTCHGETRPRPLASAHGDSTLPRRLRRLANEAVVTEDGPHPHLSCDVAPPRKSCPPRRPCLGLPQPGPRGGREPSRISGQQRTTTPQVNLYAGCQHDRLDLAYNDAVTDHPTCRAAPLAAHSLARNRQKPRMSKTSEL